VSPPSRSTAVALAAATLALAGCGGGGSKSAGSSSAAPVSFPSAQGKATVGDLVRGLGQGPALAPSVSQLSAGNARFAFGLFDRANKQIAGAQVAVYTASGSQTDVRGPYPARYESLDTDPRFRARTTADDPDAAKGVYVVNLPLRQGRHVLIALVGVNGRLVATTALEARVGLPGGPPQVGQPAIRIHTPTVASVGGDVSKIDTRVPPDDMHSADFASVLGRKPVLLVFATPALCQSRVCGPIVDEAEQLKSQYGDRMAFIHMEVYNDNNLQKGYRPQLKAWALKTEPWVFAIGRDGRVAARIEGAASVDELRAAIEQALRT
jgi:hypothetical protein